MFIQRENKLINLDGLESLSPLTNLTELSINFG